MDGGDNQQRQQDEIVALQAIFGASAVEIGETPGRQQRSLVLHAPLDACEARASIRFYLPETYPSSDSPIFEWIGAHDTSADDTAERPGYVIPRRQLGLSEDTRSAIAQELHRAWSEDMCCDAVIFTWVSWLDAYLAELWPRPAAPIPLPRDDSNSSSTKCIEPAQPPQVHQELAADSVRDAAPDIFTGAALEMKKSVFVAHVAHVTSGEDVQAVRDELMRDKRIAQATHNILAYRIRLDNGSICQDNDDDGETAAGKRLGHLLQLVEAENVVVVVTRWFGGTHLGPDRFKLINNAARQALEAGGFIGETAKSATAKKASRK
ncbi:hypothetical protein GGI21_002306 [Coemansia aciculifera]|uniref:Uncharacterized protein n=1 Tax=Coemansia aciculifera TaxID=417176 RepID=A0ACC1LZJ9_9FUNG|nr:hypothetical protein IWW38_004122 [Coemansia aciculifera]KAJ2909016.1 hypothetical protein GGI21_002306 [Coemansia aciculifera]